LEWLRGHRSSLALSADGGRAYLVYVNQLGESFHSTDGQGAEPLVFDDLGSWSEAPASCPVSARIDQMTRRLPCVVDMSQRLVSKTTLVRG
jgi:hypothetical protein